MLLLRFMVMMAGLGLFGAVGAFVAYDIFLSTQLAKLLRRREEGERAI